jgi:Lon protease-like protein
MNEQPPPTSSSSAATAPLPLFPLGTVLFPGAHLGLKVFEARYLDLVSECLRTNQPFGVICLRQGADHGPQKSVQLESVGVLAHIDQVDAERPGILRLSCKGGRRFRLVDKPAQRDNGLWVAAVQLLADDAPRQPGAAMMQTVSALAEAIRKLQDHDQAPFEPPYRLDDAGWVANRWCELLPVSMSAKQKLMELDDPVIRLSLVDGFLRDKKVVVG